MGIRSYATDMNGGVETATMCTKGSCKQCNDLVARYDLAYQKCAQRLLDVDAAEMLDR